MISKRIIDTYLKGDKTMELISIIVPCYNEEASLPFFYEEIIKVTSKMISVNFEFLFINDGSKDSTLNIIEDLANIDDRVKYISFSRNFGKESAIYAGLENSSGDYVCMMDADLQDPPYLLNEMYSILKNENYDCIATRRKDRKGEPIIRSYFAKKFYKLINKISKADIVDGARDFRLMTRQMVDAILEMPEYNRFSKGIFGWVGFNTKWISYENIDRVAGETKWSFWSLLLYAIDGIIAFSTAPLSIAAIIGVLFCIISLIMIIIIISKTLIWGDPTNGWPSLACIIIFIGGLQLFCIGILGQYMSKMYLETKKRPIYIIKKKNI